MVFFSSLLAKDIDSILSEIGRQGFGAVDRVVVLRVVLLAIDLDPFRTEWDQLARPTQQESAAKLPGAIAEARQGLLSAIKFLRQEGIRNSRLLPYSMQLVGLAAFFGQRNAPPTVAQERLLRRWLWVTAFTEGFGGLNPSRILLQLKSLRRIAAGIDDPVGVDGIDLDEFAHPFPERYDQRSARVRALLCVMLRKPILRPTGESVEPEVMAEQVLERGPDSMVRVCARVESRGKVRLGSSPANRVFDVEPEQQPKKWLLSLDDATRSIILDSHYISEQAWQALVINDHRGFIENRMKTLMAVERQFMEEQAVRPPKSDQPAPSAIDVEDEVPLSENIDAETNEDLTFTNPPL